MSKRIDHIQFIVIDLFCGAGGTTTGFEEAEFDYGSLCRFLKSIGIDPPKEREVFCKVAKVVACVNHDPIAIKSHWANHHDVEHFEEDITKLYGFIYRNGILFKSPQFVHLVRLVEMYRAFYPEAKIILWASLECTNFSKAKGGLSREADSRTLAEHLHPYIIALDPDYIKIENVVEFMAWGPLVPKIMKTNDGYSYCPIRIKDKTIISPHWIPESKKNGRDWLQWRKAICDHGYRDEWRELNSADFGALTSRNRLFGCFAKPGLPIVWPAPTHAKKPEKTSLYKPLLKWEPVKKALHFNDEGRSVFNRKKPLSTRTMQRLFMGCVKHIAGGKDHFLSKYYSGNPHLKNISTDGPAGTIKTVDSHALVFITKWNSNDKNHGGHAGHSIEEPAPFPTITTQSRERLAKVDFLVNYNHNSNSTSADEPAPTITTHDKLAKAEVHFISRYNGVNGGKHDNSHGVDGPVGALGTGDNHAKVTAQFIQLYYSGSSIEDPAPVINKGRQRHTHYIIINPSWGGNSGSIEEPSHVVIARQDKSPLYLVTLKEVGAVAVPVYEGDCEWTIKLKEFMALYGIADIKMRMLKVMELKVIQGFPANYILLGNQTDQKKCIGNAVHPKIPKDWAKADSEKLIDLALG